MLGILQLANEDYSEAENAFGLALRLVKNNSPAQELIGVMVDVPLADSYVERNSLAKALELYNGALKSLNKIRTIEATRIESEVHQLIAEAYIHAQAVPADDPFPRNGKTKAWYARRAGELFKHVEKERESAFREHCARAVAIADAVPTLYYQSVNARVLCANSFLGLDEVEPARKYYLEAIALAQQKYPATWREFINLNNWTNAVSTLNLAEEYEKAIPIAVSLWELNKRMELPLDFPPSKDAHPNYVSSKSVTWNELASQLKALAEVDHSPQILQDRNEALLLSCYDATTTMISVDPRHPQKFELEDFDRARARSECTAAIEANPVAPEGYILRGFVYRAEAEAVLSGAAQPWLFENGAASEHAEADLRRAMKLPERTDDLLKGSTHGLAEGVLNEVLVLGQRSQE